MEVNFKVNFIVAICAGFIGAIYFSVFPAISEGESFKEFIKIFILSFIGFSFAGFIFALILEAFY